MARPVTKSLAVAAALFGGLLAGMGANRTAVQIPTWTQIGVIPWANFTRAESLGPGLVFYPAVGFAALLFAVAAAIAFRVDRSARASRSFPVYAAVVLAAAWAVITRGLVVPAMFSLAQSGNDPAEVQRIFLSLARRWGINDVLRLLAFGLNLWALTEVMSDARAN
jgi:hypothetical protein